jgi:hypothetical protein
MAALVFYMPEAKICQSPAVRCQCPASRSTFTLRFGHAKVIKADPAEYVKPYVKTNKNDYIDAEAIAEAVTRPSMRFVPIKTDDQLDLQSLHRVRERWVGLRTAVINQIRGLLLERGIDRHSERKQSSSDGLHMTPGTKRQAWKSLKAIPSSADQRRLIGVFDSCQVCWRTMRWQKRSIPALPKTCKPEMPQRQRK